MLERIPARPGQVTSSSHSICYLLTHSHRGQSSHQSAFSQEQAKFELKTHTDM